MINWSSYLLHFATTGKTVNWYTYAGSGSVVQCGVFPPPEALVRGESAGALALEEEDALAEGVAVVMSSGGAMRDREETEEGNEEENEGKGPETRRKTAGVSRHF